MAELSIDEFLKIHNNQLDYVIVHLRGYGTPNFKIQNSFEVFYDQVPIDLDDVPEYFKMLQTIFVADDDVNRAKRHVENFRRQGADECYYLEGGVETLAETLPEICWRP
jgi:hypothetical protein